LPGSRVYLYFISRELLMPFEILDFFFMLFSGFQGAERTKIPALIGLCIFFPGIQPVFARF
jgi:hypothetical protein